MFINFFSILTRTDCCNLPQQIFLGGLIGLAILIVLAIFIAAIQQAIKK